MSTTLHRRAWLRQSSLAIAGLTIAGKFSAAGNHTAFRSPAETPVRLTSNENPYGPSPLARKAMAEAITASNRYPWDAAIALRNEIGKRYGMSADHVLLAAGSTEILGLVATYAALAKGNVVTAETTFQTCTRVAEKNGMQIVRVPLTQGKKYNLEALASRLNNETRLIYICNPNNPTGTTLPSADVKSFVEDASKKHMVLLDEAYLEYGDQPSLASMVLNNQNVIIAKTFSKIYGLAGARIGYALAHPDTINKIGALQPWKNGNTSAVSLAAARASLKDDDFVRLSKTSNRAANDYTAKELKSLGLEAIPSDTNFIYYSLASFNGNWEQQMAAKNILAPGSVEERGKWTRITIGTMEEMQAFVAAAKQIV
jgi:histidinol-phosphate aminotransferase